MHASQYGYSFLRSSCHQWKPNSITFLLPQKYLIPGRIYLLESTNPEFIMIQCEIHCPLLPTPSWTGMKCALNQSEIHHTQQQWALALPLFLVWNRYTIFPPDLFRDLHCSFHAEQQLLWTVWVCHSSQMILKLLSKTGADNKGLILNNAVVVVF